MGLLRHKLPKHAVNRWEFTGHKDWGKWKAGSHGLGPLSMLKNFLGPSHNSMTLTLTKLTRPSPLSFDSF